MPLQARNRPSIYTIALGVTLVILTQLWSGRL